MMAVFFSRDANQKSATVDALLGTEHFLKSSIDSFNLIILNDSHQHIVVDILNKTGKHPWTAGHLRMPLITHQDEVESNLAGANKLRKIPNTTPVLVHGDSTFVDKRKALVNYAQAV